MDDVTIWLSPEEAAARLSIGRTALYELLRSGQLPKVKIGSRTGIPAAALVAFARRVEAEQTGAPLTPVHGAAN